MHSPMETASIDVINDTITLLEDLFDSVGPGGFLATLHKRYDPTLDNFDRRGKAVLYNLRKYVNSQSRGLTKVRGNNL